MPPGTPTSLDINRGVRRILVSHWIDLGRVSISTVRTTVYMRGVMHKLPGSGGSLNPEVMEVLYRKIKALKGVNTVQIQLSNWSRNTTTGSWDETFDATTDARRHASSDQRRQDTYEIR